MVRAADDAWGEVTRTLAQLVVPVLLSESGDSGRIGRFQVRGILGRGGMGIVYDVVDTDSGERRALKMIAVRFLQLDDSVAARRFAHEIKVLQALEHPSVVRFFEYGLAETPDGEHLAFFVMERLEGHTISEQLARRERFPLPEVLRIATTVADALTYLESRGVQHRDIKPGNVFLERSGRVVLMDFGLARSDQFTKLTRAGHIVGTIFYMSPERLRGVAADIRSDVFALGVLLFEMTFGQRPFVEEDPTAMVRTIRRGITWPGGFEQNEDQRALKEAVEQMTAAEPDRRPLPNEIVSRFAAHLPAPTAKMPAAAMLAPPAGGPTWTVTALITITCSLLAFVLGIFIATPPPASQDTAVEIPVVAPPPPPPPKKIVALPSPEPVHQTAEEAFAYGDRQLKSGAHQKAIIAFEKALEMNPAYSDVYRRLGDAHLSQGQIGKAKEAYDRYRKLRPDAPDGPDIDRLLESIDE